MYIHNILLYIYVCTYINILISDCLILILTVFYNAVDLSVVLGISLALGISAIIIIIIMIPLICMCIYCGCCKKCCKSQRGSYSLTLEAVN